MKETKTTINRSVIILAGGTTSTVLDKSHYKDMVIFLPANWVTSIITFTGCDTIDGTFLPVVNADDVGAVTIASVAASQCIGLNGEIRDSLSAVPYLKIVATTAQATTDKVIRFTLMR